MTMKNANGQRNIDRKRQRKTYWLSDHRIPREAYENDIVLTNEWATPCVVMPTYAEGEMTDSGSRWCPKSRTTSSWLLPSQTLIMAANQDALAWNHLLHFVRRSLPTLIPSILAAQAEWVNREYGQSREGGVPEHFDDARLVLRAYSHNIDAVRNHYLDMVDVDLLDCHACCCAAWMEYDGCAPTGPCPQQEWLLERLLRRGPMSYVTSQIKIWRAADPWSLLPLAGQLPEVGPDMGGFELTSAWRLLWIPQCTSEEPAMCRGV